jgi:hypothetical protein
VPGPSPSRRTVRPRPTRWSPARSSRCRTDERSSVATAVARVAASYLSFRMGAFRRGRPASTRRSDLRLLDTTSERPGSCQDRPAEPDSEWKMDRNGEPSQPPFRKPTSRGPAHPFRSNSFGNNRVARYVPSVPERPRDGRWGRPGIYFAAPSTVQVRVRVTRRRFESSHPHGRVPKDRCVPRRRQTARVGQAEDVATCSQHSVTSWGADTKASDVAHLDTKRLGVYPRYGRVLP